jgi:NAD(P)-dependent dehydrogenase (short-subunit alcohol dehydrogenase family)
MRIVMTGGTAGIGLEAAKALLAAGAAITLGARAPERLPGALRGRVEARPLDLSRLESVRAFVARLAGETPVDALILNAGLQVTKPRRSADGHELTFAVNHLAHYLLARLAIPYLATGARVILTASGTHDPEQKTAMPPPRHADAPLLADPDRDQGLDRDPTVAGRRAYSTSKLCNVMTVRTLAAALSGSRPDVMVAAFDPGFTPGTGLARDYPPPVGLIFRFAMPLVVRGARVSTPRLSGGLLADLATAPRYLASRGAYWSFHRGRIEDIAPSVLARDEAACAKLWRDSARMVGLPEAMEA